MSACPENNAYGDKLQSEIDEDAPALRNLVSPKRRYTNLLGRKATWHKEKVNKYIKKSLVRRDGVA